MLPIIIKFIDGIIISIAIITIAKNILKLDIKITNLRTIMLMMIMIIPMIYFYQTEYNTILTIFTYMISVLVIRKLGNIDLKTSIVTISLIMITIFVVDLIVSLCELNIFKFKYEMLRDNMPLNLINNIIIAIVSILICKTKLVIDKFRQFCLKINESHYLSIIFFAILSIFIFTILVLNLTTQLKVNIFNTLSIVSITIFLILYYIYMEECNNYDSLKDEYDNLFDCIQNFEEWIDNEQLYRHEMKNNLSIIRGMTKNKNIINKIDEILDMSIVIDDQTVETLKSLPKGDLKGLLYYKTAISNKKKINIVFEISEIVTTKLKKINKNKTRDLCIILGIYLDNAIEAAEKSKEKNVVLEIYEINKELNFVISNTYDEILSIKNMNRKNFTTKGGNHGRGLYYANKIIKKCKWINKDQMFLNKYFIQKLIIK